jgi:hypothetical protein
MAANRTRTVTCRGCGRTAECPDPAEGHPYGWYYLTVNVPPWFNSDSERNYRAIGLFCSVSCIARRMDAIRSDEELHRQAYEAE